MKLTETIDGNNYRIIGHDIKLEKIRRIFVPGMALRVIARTEHQIIVHIDGERYSISCVDALKIRVNPI